MAYSIPRSPSSVTCDGEGNGENAEQKGQVRQRALIDPELPWELPWDDGRSDHAQYVGASQTVGGEEDEPDEKTTARSTVCGPDGDTREARRDEKRCCNCASACAGVVTCAYTLCRHAWCLSCAARLDEDSGEREYRYPAWLTDKRGVVCSRACHTKWESELSGRHLEGYVDTQPRNPSVDVDCRVKRVRDRETARPYALRGRRKTQTAKRGKDIGERAALQPNVVRQTPQKPRRRRTTPSDLVHSIRALQQEVTNLRHGHAMMLAQQTEMLQLMCKM